MERHSQHAEALILVAKEAHNGFRVRVTGAALTGLKRLDTCRSQRLDVGRDARV